MRSRTRGQGQIRSLLQHPDRQTQFPGFNRKTLLLMSIATTRRCRR
jgi:hypothetical protein